MTFELEGQKFIALNGGPRFGERMAELVETPVMLVVIIVAARWIVRRLALPLVTSTRLGMGCVGLGLLLVAAGSTPEEQADRYAELLDGLLIRQTAVMAISGGGPSAIHFALRHPDRCSGLVLISTCAGKVDTPVPLWFKLVKLFVRWPVLAAMLKRRTKKDLEWTLRRSIVDPIIRARTVRDTQVRQSIEEALAGVFDRITPRLPGTENDIRIMRTAAYPLEQIAVPVLVIHGTGDRLLPFTQHGKALAARISGAQLLAVEGGEHMAVFTHRDEVKARVARFLRDLAPI